ncbi:DUF3455 domain-containing protein [Roseateles sp.]|uniref:DUF3455 domain-containing protein n=1 Tax=Roseateles sp. TaxID=1971397 RepID=UPI003D0E4D1D
MSLKFANEVFGWTRALALVTGLAFAGLSSAAEVPVPESLVAPGTVAQSAVIFARGSQIYRCELDPVAPGSGKWVFQAPEADLFQDAAFTKLMGRHYDGPTWEAFDGSKVAGKARASVPSASPKAIPQLLLDALPTPSPGVFQGVSFIQRLDTKGGVAQDVACGKGLLGTQLRVPYTAAYVFYK